MDTEIRKLSAVTKEELFAKIRIDFLFSNPFLSVLALSIPTRYESALESLFITDGTQIAVDENRLEEYVFDELKWLYAHTLLHIVLRHPSRGKNKEWRLWNASCDIVTTLLLDDMKNVGKKPQNEKLLPQFRFMVAEQVYERLWRDEQDGSESYDDPRDIEPSTKTQQNEESLDALIVQALTVAKSCALSHGFLAEIEQILRTDINLLDILKEYLVLSHFERQSSYTVPNRRFIHKGLYLPGMRSRQQAVCICIALDCSASVTLDEYRRFLGVVCEIGEDFLEYEMIVIPFDSEVKQNLILAFDSHNPPTQEQLRIPKSDGGTNFQVVVEFMRTHDFSTTPSLLLALTDGYFADPVDLCTPTLFLLSQQKNEQRLSRYGRVVPFKI